jgi:integrase
MHVLTPAEEAKYLAAIDALAAEKIVGKRPAIAARYQDLRDLSVLMLNQGCRPEELRAMTQTAVDLAAGTLTVIRGKSKAARRTLRLTAASRDIMARRLATLGRWVFPSHRRPGGHLGPVQRLHDAALKRSGLSFVPYDLRHTAASRWAEGHVDIVTIAAWLGHANLRTVQKYVHLSKGHLNAEAEKFERGWLAMQEQKPEGKERVN